MKILQIKGYGDIKSNLTFSEVEKPTISDNGCYALYIECSLKL